MKAVSKYQSLKHYKWGSDCDGWNLVEEDSLSVKQELMPGGTKEVKLIIKQRNSSFISERQGNIRN